MSIRPSSLAALAAVLAAALVLGAGSASAGRVDPPGDPDANHCVNAAGVDLNVLYGVSDQFRTRECQDISAGEHWRVPLVWIVNFGADSVYPPGYTPADPDPIDDFVTKLVAVKAVLDGGTLQEHTLVFAPSEALRTDINAEQLEPGFWGAPYPMASMQPRLAPLGVGDHTFQLSIVLSALHCDGIAPNVDENCLPAGEVPFTPTRPLIISTPTQE